MVIVVSWLVGRCLFQPSNRRDNILFVVVVSSFLCPIVFCTRLPLVGVLRSNGDEPFRAESARVIRDTQWHWGGGGVVPADDCLLPADRKRICSGIIMQNWDMSPMGGHPHIDSSLLKELKFLCAEQDKFLPRECGLKLIESEEVTHWPTSTSPLNGLEAKMYNLLYI